MAAEEFSIGQLASEFGITPRAIRFYEDQGLLAPGRRGGQRVYSRRDRARLKLILRGRRLGFALSESRELLDLYDSVDGQRAQLEVLLGMLAEKRQRLESQRRDLDAALAELASVEDRCQAALRQRDGTRAGDRSSKP
jgi:DNA-binding transcriptional MerR regulator